MKGAALSLGGVHWYWGSGVLGREANNLRDSWISTGIGGEVGRWEPNGW